MVEEDDDDDDDDEEDDEMRLRCGLVWFSSCCVVKRESASGRR